MKAITVVVLTLLAGWFAHVPLFWLAEKLNPLAAIWITACAMTLICVLLAVWIVRDLE